MRDKCWSSLGFRESVWRLGARVIITHLYFVDGKFKEFDSYATD